MQAVILIAILIGVIYAIVQTIIDIRNDKTRNIYRDEMEQRFKKYLRK